MADSVVRRLNGERLVLLAWSRAILLQLAHPLVAAGVADHSTFREGPVTAARRLHHTVQSMLALTFGDERAQEATLQLIRQIHTRVNGTLRERVGIFPAGTRYSAEDPALVEWVHLTLLDSVVRAYELLVEPLDAQARDAYCREAAPVAVALAARESEVPLTWADAEAAMAAVLRSGTLTVGRDAQALAAAVLTPPLAVVTAPIASVNRLVTAGWLPPDIRAQYGLAWSESRARRCDRVVRLIRATRRVTPDVLAYWGARATAAP